MYSCFHQTVEVCKAARRGQSCSSQGEQQPSSTSPGVVAPFIQSGRELSHPTNQTPFDLLSVGGRSHLDEMQITLQWGRDLIQSYFPAGDFSTDRFHPQIFIQCQETLMISHISSPCLCVAGRQMAAQCDVWKDAWRCWQRAAGPLPASITPPLHFPLSSLHLICFLEFLPAQLFKKKSTTFHYIFPQHSPILFFFLSASLHHILLCS